MIGSRANIVAIGIIERKKIGHIPFGQWLKSGILVSVPPLALATVLLYLQFYL
jgi:Na+/H+ antiporter NhaD/arsenite permease-like protein